VRPRLAPENRFARPFGSDRLTVCDGEHLRLGRQLGEKVERLRRLVPLASNGEQLKQEHPRLGIARFGPDMLDKRGACAGEIALRKKLIGLMHGKEGRPQVMRPPAAPQAFWAVLKSYWHCWPCAIAPFASCV